MLVDMYLDLTFHEDKSMTNMIDNGGKHGSGKPLLELRQDLIKILKIPK